MIVGIGALNELWDCSESWHSADMPVNADVLVVEHEKISHIYSRTDVGRPPPRVASASPKPKTS